LSSSKGWSTGDAGRASSSHRTHGCRESPLGSKVHPGRVSEVRVSGFRQDRGLMRVRRIRRPTGGWREFLTRHASDIRACDFFCVPTVLFQTLHVFSVIRLANRQILHVEVTPHPAADWAAQQIVECCAWDRAPPRFRDNRYGGSFDRRVRGLGIRQVRTPFRSPRTNAVAGRWVRSVRSECLDHMIVFSEDNLGRALSVYVTCYNRWRPHRSWGQTAPCGEASSRPQQICRKIAAEPVLGYTTFTGLQHDKFLRPTGAAADQASPSPSIPRRRPWVASP
jgi:putative transposase